VREWRLSRIDSGKPSTQKNQLIFDSISNGFLVDLKLQSVCLQVLAHDDLVDAELLPTVILEDGESIGPDSRATPFFSLPSVRNCWSSEYEHGMCWLQALIIFCSFPGIESDKTLIDSNAELAFLHVDCRCSTEARHVQVAFHLLIAFVGLRQLRQQSRLTAATL